MDGWTFWCSSGKWMDGLSGAAAVNGWMDFLVQQRSGGWMDGWMDGWMELQHQRWMDGWMELQQQRWMDGWMDGAAAAAGAAGAARIDG
eukprot:scaffold398_cov356-Pavlova_lutheri.AAC.8